MYNKLSNVVAVSKASCSSSECKQSSSAHTNALIQILSETTTTNDDDVNVLHLAPPVVAVWLTHIEFQFHLLHNLFKKTGSFAKCSSSNDRQQQRRHRRRRQRKHQRFAACVTLLKQQPVQLYPKTVPKGWNLFAWRWCW